MYRWCGPLTFIMAGYMGAGLLAISLSAAAADPDSTMGFTATIKSISGTCTVSNALANRKLVLPDVAGDPGLAGKVTSVMPFTWEFSGCPKLTPVQSPYFTVTGTNTGAPSAEVAWFSRDATSGSEGFYIVVANDGSLSTLDTAKLYKTDGSTHYPINGGANTAIADGTKINLWAGIACGSAAECQAAGLVPGTLTSRLTFDFYYR